MERTYLRTGRIVLRALRDSDLDVLASYRCDPHQARLIAEPMTRAEVAMHIARHRAGWSCREGEALSLAIARVDADTAVGEVVIRHVSDRQRIAEVGIVLAPSHRGTGLAVDAAMGMVWLCFEQFRFHRLIAYTDIDNRAAVRLTEMIGFRREGILRKHMYRYGEWRDEHLLALLEEDWPQVRQRRVGRLAPVVTWPPAASWPPVAAGAPVVTCPPVATRQPAVT
jgi:RimJ/RimL family protein N-acetyltransferase